MLIFLHLLSCYVSDWLLRNFALIYRFGVDNLDELSCSDKPCSLKRRDHSKSLEQYKPVSLNGNKSFRFKRTEIVVLKRSYSLSEQLFRGSHEIFSSHVCRVLIDWCWKILLIISLSLSVKLYK